MSKKQPPSSRVWQDDKRHEAFRKRTILYILKKTRSNAQPGPNKTVKLSTSFIKAVEFQLYRSASSLEEYIDFPTIDQRLIEAAKQVVASKGRKRTEVKNTNVVSSSLNSETDSRETDENVFKAEGLGSNQGDE